MNFATRSKVYRAAAWRKVRNFLGLDTDTYPPRPEGTKLSPSQGLGAATQAITRNNAFDVTNISKWQLDARNRLAEMLGYTKPEAVPETIAQRGPTTVESDRHDLERMTYYLRVRPDTDVPVTTVVRKDLGGPLPVFILLAGSTSGVHLGWGEAKDRVFEYVNAHLSAPRERYNALMEDPAHIEAVLQKGAERAREEAAVTMDRLRAAVGLGRFV